jgi:hypothetical protein
MAVAALPEETVVVGASGLVSVSGEAAGVGATANELCEVNQGNWEIDMKGVVVDTEDGVAPVEVKEVELTRALVDTVLLGMGKVADVGVVEGAEVMVEGEHSMPRRPQSEDVDVVEGGAVDEGPQPMPNKAQSDDVGVGLPPVEVEPVGVPPCVEVGGQNRPRPSTPQPDEVGDGAGGDEPVVDPDVGFKGEPVPVGVGFVG